MDNNSNLLDRVQIFKSNRRHGRRYKYTDTFKVVTVNSKRINSKVLGVDISVSGIGFISNIKFELNDVLEIIFDCSNITIPVTVRVSHVNLFDNGFFVGGQFIAIQNIYRELLKHYLT